MRSLFFSYTATGAVILLSIVFLVWDVPRAYLESLITENTVLSPLLFVSAMFISTVIAPVTVLPLVPAVSPIFGWQLTFLYALVGWLTGAVVAFLLARYAGRRVLERWISLEAVDRYEHYLPTGLQFWSVVLLRMIVPVDALSYALGLFSRISLWRYTLASAIGTAPFAFIFSYAGEVWARRNYPLLAIIIGGSLTLFGVAAFFFYKRHKT